MADTGDEEDKSELVSEKRLQRAWEEGKIPMGRDAASVAALACATLALVALGPSLRHALADALTGTLEVLPGLRDPDATGSSLHRVGQHVQLPFLLGLGVLAAAALGGIAATVAQTKGQLWAEHALPDPEKLFQASRLKRLFSRELLTDLGLSVLKVGVVGGAAYWALKDEFLTVGKLLVASTEGQLTGLFRPLGKAAVTIVAAMAAVAGADLALTHWRFRKGLRMTKEEAKREHREEEGDPLIRSRRRRRHRELAKAHAVTEVPRADAVVVNPTHIAVAVRYRKDESAAPRVLAKGKGVLAEHIRDLARKSGVPIVEDIPLARLLYRKVKVGGQIPAETFKAVAAVLAYVYRLTGRRPGGGAG